MGAILSSIFGLLSGVPGLIGDYFQRKHDIETIKLETQRQIAVETQRLAAQIAEAEYQRASIALQATGRGFKYFTFVMWFGPYMVGLVSPELSQKIFANLGGMPEWYVQSVVMLMFVIWGVAASSPVVGSIFTNMASYFAQRRQDKISLKGVDKKSFYEGLRAAQGFVSKADVIKFDKVIDSGSRD